MTPPELCLEALEARIAPAVLVNGANLIGGSDNPSSVEASLGDDAVVVAKVTSGMAIIWYDSLRNDVMAVSVGPGTALEIFGDVAGDIVGNLTAEGLLSDSDNDPTNGQDGAVLLPNSITSLKVSKTLSEKGSIGSIITGGPVSKVAVDGELGGIYAGNGVFDAQSRPGSTGLVEIFVGVDVNPLDGAFNPFFFLAGADALSASGGSISGVTVQTGKSLQLIAGDGFSSIGGAGQSGGSISNITIESAVAETSDPASYLILAGDGGDGTQGGAGGSISMVSEASSSKTALVLAGNGGDGSAGTGGAGGSISKVNAQSDQTSYTITAGDGGLGTTSGGTGGSVTFANFSGATTRGAIVLMANFTADGFEDVMTLDSASGQMVLMANNSGGSTFSPVLQPGTDPGPGDDTPFIAPVGLTPSSAAHSDIDLDGDVDLIVGYANSSGLGVYLNDGAGIFTGSFFTTGVEAVDIVAGEFLSNGEPSVAILSTSGGSTSISLARWNAVSSALETISGRLFVEQTAAPVDLEKARLNSDLLDDLFIGFDNGNVISVASLGSTQTPLEATAITQVLPGRLSNISVDDLGQSLLAFNGSNRALAISSFVSGALVASEVLPDISGISGQLQSARFAGISGDILLQSSQKGVSSISRFSNPDDDAWGLVRTATSTSFLKTFASTFTGDGVAAVTSSLDTLAYNIAGTSFVDSTLPFSGKSVQISAGDGGAGGTGKGGIGGSVSSLAVEAADLAVTTGNGGMSTLSQGGAGGNLAVGGQFSINTPTKYNGLLSAKAMLVVATGSGGDSSGSMSSANGGKGGDITLLTVQGGDSDIVITTGDGGSAKAGKGGNGGNLSKATASTTQANFAALLGDGGSSASGANGGNGGSASTFSFSQILEPEAEELSDAYLIEIIGGAGGNALFGRGGNGGFLKGLAAVVDPSNDESNYTPNGTDTTTTVSYRGGNGGSGITGGNGGSVTASKADAILDQVLTDEIDPAVKYVVRNYSVLIVAGGSGGSGTVGSGGLGGSAIDISGRGMSLSDPDAPAVLPGLDIRGGEGGNGATTGGHGGSVTNLTSANSSQPGSIRLIANALASAQLSGGDGGDGGTGAAGMGGSVTNAKVAVAGVFSLPVDPLAPPTEVRIIGGDVLATAGGGGNSTSGAGGAGGSIRGGTYDSQLAGGDFAGPPAPTVVLTAGNGGDGRSIGGAGGMVTSLSVGSPQIFGQGTPAGAREITGPVLVGGDGGDATSTTDARSKAGVGGSITKIVQPKDLNSFISLLQAGSGGDAQAGVGGNGGDVIAVRTAGFIGQPFLADGTRSGVFVDGGPQGVFAGAGGDGGAADGIAGKIANIVARQISAIGGAPLAGGLFAPASSISAVRADLIGFDANANGTFNSSSGTQSPESATPIDGFLYAKTVSGITTSNSSRTAGFTFVA